MPPGALISIVTPAYNAARFIEATIASVKAQTYPSWEMIVVDDCSQDDTCSNVAKSMADDPRIKLIQQEKNGGPAAARNAAIEAANGKYIAFLDSDDLWLPAKLEMQIAFMRDSGAAISFTGYRRISEAGNTTGRLIHIPKELSYRELLKNTAIATSTVVIDRERTGAFRMTKTYYDDYALWLELLKRGFVAHGLQQDMMRYRIVGESVSRRKGKSALWVWRTYRQIEKLSMPYAAWCFVNYAWRASLKYRGF